MVNLLIAYPNSNYAINLMNTIIAGNSNIRICGITLNLKETLKILNHSESIDIILLDYTMNDLFKYIENSKGYNKSFIVLYNDSKLFLTPDTNSLIYEYVDISKNSNTIINSVNNLIDYKTYFKNNYLRNRILEEINYLGYDVSYKGTQYLITAIEYILNNPNKNLDKLETHIYPMLADLYKNSTHNIKCNINRANNIMYCECETSKLRKYFSFHDDTKPKIKTVINTIVNKIS